MSVLLVLAGLVSTVAPTEVALFGGPGTQWAVVTREGEVVRRLSQIGGLKPVDAAISPDGSRWAVIALNSENERELFLLNDAEGKPLRSMKSPGDVLDGVSFSPDGKWVYLSANDKNQRRFEKQPMLYAQVYRLRFDDGHLERVSMSRGCHMWPKSIDKDFAAVSHATCFGGRSLELIALGSGHERVLLPPNANVGEVAVDSTKTRLFFTLPGAEGADFRVLDLKTGKQETWLTSPIDSLRSRPLWSSDGTNVLFQSNAVIWRARPNHALEKLVSLSEGKSE